MKTIARTMPAFAVLCALVAPAEAQDRDIVVTGQRELTEERAFEVVRRVARPVDGQLARFHAPVCPKVMGFDAPYEAMVEARIKATAETVGIGAGGDGCITNLFVVIVDDGPGFVEELERTRPGALSGVSKREFERLAGQKGAARSWSVTALTNSVGTVAANPSPSAGGGAVKHGFMDSSITFDSNVRVMRVYESSNIDPPVQQAIGSSWVVLETGATFGKSLRQIADYAAMRGLAMVRPSELDGSEDTILSLFEPGVTESAPQLTSFDQAYLTGLYKAPARRWAWSQARYMADQIARETGDGAR